jgi:endonuclease/exonuclease/phosphatase family metal-dependent hydrolase
MSQIVKIIFINFQSGMMITKSYGQYFQQGWKYFLPHNSIGLEKVVNFLNKEKPDIVSLAEIDSYSWRSKQVDQVKFISQKTDLKESVFFSTHRLGQLINQGNAILSKYSLTKTAQQRLPGFGERRYLCQAEIDLGQQKLLYFITHLSTNKNVNIAQRNFIAKKILNHNQPAILTGDFNSEKDCLNIIANNTKMNEIQFKPTFPTWQPRFTLDHIFIHQDYKIVNKQIYEKAKFSDHLPIGAEIKV